MAEVKFTDPSKDQIADLEKKVRLRIYSKLEDMRRTADILLFGSRAIRNY